MPENLDTPIRIKKSTRDKLKSIGKKGDSYDDVITMLIKKAKIR